MHNKLESWERKGDLAITDISRVVDGSGAEIERLSLGDQRRSKRKTGNRQLNVSHFHLVDCWSA